MAVRTKKGGILNKQTGALEFWAYQKGVGRHNNSGANKKQRTLALIATSLYNKLPDKMRQKGPSKRKPRSPAIMPEGFLK